MALVILGAFFMALLFLLFKVFERRNVALLPAIVVNYIAAFLCGAAVVGPWSGADLSGLWTPSVVLGALFIILFYLTGLSSQRVGVAATAVASKMSLVLTVVFAVLVYGDEPGILGWTGIALALVGVVLASWVPSRAAVRGAWLLPTMLFLGNAVIDITINWVQRMKLTEDTEAIFPTLVFGVSGLLGIAWLLFSPERKAFRMPSTWIGGTVMGVINYGALYFVVQALARGGMPSSSVYPLINIVVILVGTGLSMILFQERPRRVQYLGITCSVLALLLILKALPE